MNQNGGPHQSHYISGASRVMPSVTRMGIEAQRGAGTNALGGNTATTPQKIGEMTEIKEDIHTQRHLRHSRR